VAKTAKWKGDFLVEKQAVIGEIWSNPLKKGMLAAPP